MLYLALFFLANVACGSENAIDTIVESQQFKDYWYQGKAELNRYELKQARYGEIHAGDAVLIFVTEDFLTDKQVKLERGASENAATVLKLNAARKFFTGIYPYSILTSVFTPIDLQDRKHSLKVSNSNQEWCGHTYVQINWREGQYEGISHSYFQDEADQEFRVSPEILEDELWTRIRLAPYDLPLGEIELLPALHFIRLRRLDFKVQKATAELSTLIDPELSPKPVQVYSIQYKSIDRTLKIKFENDFPHAIVAWEETYLSGWGRGARELTTTAVRTHSLMTDYWNKNSAADSTYRRMLGF